jgi:hypothetical protein
MRVSMKMQAVDWSLQEWFHFFASLLPSVFVVTVVLVANLSTREIQNTPSLRYIERKETALEKERERSPELSSRC